MEQPERVPARRRGRRASGEDTREEILTAARAEFVEQGYSDASVRGVARRAGVDPGLVRYWFPGGKSELFATSLMHPRVNPAWVVAQAMDGPPEQLAARLLTTILTVWDPPEVHERLRVVLGAVVTGAEGGAVPGFLRDEVFATLARRIPGPDALLRAEMLASHVAGLLIARYVVHIEPLASAPVPLVVSWMAPSFQRYLDGPVPAPVDTDSLLPPVVRAYRDQAIAGGRPDGDVGDAGP